MTSWRSGYHNDRQILLLASHPVSLTKAVARLGSEHSKPVLEVPLGEIVSWCGRSGNFCRRCASFLDFLGWRCTFSLEGVRDSMPEPLLTIALLPLFFLLLSDIGQVLLAHLSRIAIAPLHLPVASTRIDPPTDRLGHVRSAVIVHNIYGTSRAGSVRPADRSWNLRWRHWAASQSSLLSPGLSCSVSKVDKRVRKRARHRVAGGRH